jgi:tetratricopeptide (TPR) repeat protein
MQSRRFEMLLISGFALISVPHALAQGAPVEDASKTLQAPGLSKPSAAAIDAYNAGVRLMGANKPGDASVQFTAAIKATPDFADAHFNLGAALLMIGDPKGALPELEKSVQINPKLVRAWAVLGSCYQALGQTNDAVNSFHKYLLLEPNGELAPKVRALAISLSSELKRTAGMSTSDADDYFAEATFGGLARWKSMPVFVYIRPAADVPGFKPEFVDILKEAFKTWQQTSQGKISFEFVNDPSKAQISCAFTNSLQDAITAAEGGHTVIIPDSKGNILKADVSLLTRPANGTELNPNYARRVDLHEVGHALGILGHSKNPDDVMFATVLATTRPVDLTGRDVKTISMIYGDEGLKLIGKGIDIYRLMSGDPNSKLNRILVLNNEATVLINNGKFAAAMAKWEEAQKLDPSNQVVNCNLGAVYGNMAALEMNMRNFLVAEVYFKKAVPLLEKGASKDNLASILKNYSLFLRIQNRVAEAAKVDARLSSMGVH